MTTLQSLIERFDNDSKLTAILGLMSRAQGRILGALRRVLIAQRNGQRYPETVWLNGREVPADRDVQPGIDQRNTHDENNARNEDGRTADEQARFEQGYDAPRSPEAEATRYFSLWNQLVEMFEAAEPESWRKFQPFAEMLNRMVTNPTAREMNPELVAVLNQDGISTEVIERMRLNQAKLNANQLKRDIPELIELYGSLIIDDSISFDDLTSDELDAMAESVQRQLTSRANMLMSRMINVEEYTTAKLLQGSAKDVGKWLHQRRQLRRVVTDKKAA